MNPIFESARTKTQRAVDTFQHAMKQVDAELRSIVSRHPELLDEAEDLQAMRGFNMYRDGLQPAEQPAPILRFDGVGGGPTGAEGVQVEAITFDELVAIGREQNPGRVEMPWSFQYKGHPITHENDNCYLVPGVTGAMQRFERGDLLVTQSTGALAVVKQAEKMDLIETPAADRDSLLPPIVDTPHTPTEAEGADIGRPVDAVVDDLVEHLKTLGSSE